MEQVHLTIEKNSGLLRIADAYLKVQANNPSDPRLRHLTDVTCESFSYNPESLREFVPEPSFSRGFFPYALALARYYKALTQ